MFHDGQRRHTWSLTESLGISSDQNAIRSCRPPSEAVWGSEEGVTTILHHAGTVGGNMHLVQATRRRRRNVIIPLRPPTSTSPFRPALKRCVSQCSVSFSVCSKRLLSSKKENKWTVQIRRHYTRHVTSLQLSCSHDSGTVAMVIHHVQILDGDLISVWMTGNSIHTRRIGLFLMRITHPDTDHILIPAVNGAIHDLDHISGRNLLTVLRSTAVVRAVSTNEDQDSKPDQFKQSKARKKKKTFGENTVSSASW